VLKAHDHGDHVVSGDAVYKTRFEAEAGMKTVKVCTSN
jgi:hypothetical protein